ncbi:hypothetical protein OG259_08235 [Streptomyces sp. NBC_00250]|uniref:hypothetical protein n=1 Tax=Streptomyces sp. NBC_00250 TaxID=2903641 RepID=UPI002E2C372C|nr:hypothetical protein [Streptomyces sp. NBC_00250]
MTHTNFLEPAGGNGGKAQFNPEMAAQAFDLHGQGVFDKVLPVPGFRGAYGMVLGSVTEYDPVSDRPIMGEAVVTLHSVVGLDGQRVHVRVESRWPEPLYIRVQLMWFL